MTSEMFDVKEVLEPRHPNSMNLNQERFISITAKLDKIETVSRARQARNELTSAIAALIGAYERATGLPVVSIGLVSIQALGLANQSSVEVEVRV